MPYEDVTLTRDALYEQVWAKPVTQLAKEFGISDVAIAKICRKLNVPVPPRGYWARVSAGQTPKRPPLPVLGKSVPDRHVLRRWHGPGGPTPAEPQGDAPPIPVPAELESPHRLVRQLRSVLQRSSRSFDDKKAPFEQVLDVAVSEAAAERALRIMDALIKGLEARGHVVEIREEKREPVQSYGGQQVVVKSRWLTCAVIESTAVEFSLSEGYETVEIPPEAPSELRATHSWGLPSPIKEHIPNGKLTLALGDRWEKQTCADTKRWALETRLGEFVLMLESRAAAIRAREAEWKREAEERRRREEEWQKQEQQRRHEEGLVEDLMRRVRLRSDARRMRALAAAVAKIDEEDEADVRRRWAEWVLSYADRVEREVVRALPDPEKGVTRGY